MKAVQVSEYGDADVIHVIETERPEPEAGQLRVRVKAAGVRPWDALVREGQNGVPQTLPLTPGSDIAGTIGAIGPEVSGFSIGTHQKESF